MGGDGKSGYLRIDDERTSRLQIKWAHGRVNLERKRADYAKRLEKGKRGRPTGIEVDLEARVLSARSKPKKELAPFAWRGQQCGMGLLWNCEVCGRTLLAQVNWFPEERLHDVAREVLGSLDDHGEGGWRTWALDGMEFLAPERYELTTWKWLTGYLEFNFLQGRRQLKVVRWGLVPQLLGKRSLQEWYETERRKHREISFQVKEAEPRRHDGLAAWGKLRGIRPTARALGRWILRRPVENQFLGAVWHCPESNRLYVVETVEAEESIVFEGVVDSLVCHQEA